MRTMLLGVIVRDITDPFFAGAIEAGSIEASRARLQHRARPRPRPSGRGDRPVARPRVAPLRRDRAARRHERSASADRGPARRPVPVVALWQGSRPDGIPSVSVDNRAGIVAVLDHLWALGHRRIGFAGGQAARRHPGARGGLRRVPDRSRRAAPRGLRPAHVATTPPAVGQRLAAMLGSAEPPTAVIASTDVLAIGCSTRPTSAGCGSPRTSR